MFHIVGEGCFSCGVSGYLTKRNLEGLHQDTPDRFWCCSAVSNTYRQRGKLYHRIDHRDWQRTRFICNDCHKKLDILKSLEWLRKSKSSLP